MFTGIITNVVKLQNLSALSNQDLLITLELPKNNNRTLEIGCSIACNGACLTLVEKTKDTLSFQASPETLNKTSIGSWKVGDKINLEFALRMGDELGGHLVAGHVDDVTKIIDIQSVNKDSWNFIIALPKNLTKFIAPKGSVVLNGVSLTINEVSDETFSVNIIKHTFDNTNFSSLKVGDTINLEVDLIARYVERMTNCK